MRWDFSQNLIGGQDLAVRGVSKLKVEEVFMIFRKFNMMLELVDLYLYN